MNLYSPVMKPLSGFQMNVILLYYSIAEVPKLFGSSVLIKSSASYKDILNVRLLSSGKEVLSR